MSGPFNPNALAAQLRALIEGETHPLVNLANAAALLYE